MPRSEAIARCEAAGVFFKASITSNSERESIGGVLPNYMQKRKTTQSPALRT